MTLVGIGNCTITAAQAGSATVATATSVVQTFAVGKTPNVITFTLNKATMALGDAAPVITASASSGLVVTYTSTTPLVCSVTGSTITVLTTGTCGIQAAQAGSATVALATPVTQTFTVTLRPNVITFTLSSGSITWGDAAPVITGSASSALAVTYTSTTLPVCTVSGSTITVLTSGTCSITATQAGSATFVAATPVIQSFTVALKSQTITWAQTLGTVAPDTTVVLSASASSTLAVTYSAAPSSVCTVTGSTVTLLTVGTCTVTARQTGDSRFAAASDVVKSFKVRYPQEITFNPISDQTMDAGFVSLDAYTDSQLTVSFASSTPLTCSVSGSLAVLRAAGTCTIVASRSETAVYAAATPQSQSFTITALPQTITFVQPDDTFLVRGFVVLDVASDSLLPITLQSNTPSVCLVSSSTAVVTLISSGTCSITARQSGTNVYLPATSVTRTFLVDKTSQSITFTQPDDQNLSAGFFVLSVSASSSLPVSLSSNTPSVCSVASATGAVTLLIAGTCSITASQAGNAYYVAATPVTKSFSIAKITQEITLFVGGAQNPRNIDTSMSGLELLVLGKTGTGAVSYGASNPAVCNVVGLVVNFYSVGTCTVTATVATDARYTAASSTVTFNVASAYAYTVTFDGNGGNSPAAQNYMLGGVLALPVDPGGNTGYSFNGWYTAASGGTRVNNGDAASTRTLYAQWTATSNYYTVTYDANNGVLTGAATQGYTIVGTLSFPSAPTRTGYDFTGWFTEAAVGSQVYSGAAASTRT
ncbi:MAG: InlB B-repeat-containing protein, partial [Polynucleobacter sp.]